MKSPFVLVIYPTGISLIRTLPDEYALNDTLLCASRHFWWQIAARWSFSGYSAFIVGFDIQRSIHSSEVSPRLGSGNGIRRLHARQLHKIGERLAKQSGNTFTQQVRQTDIS